MNSQFPSDGDEQVKAAVAARAQRTFGVGDDIIALVIADACLDVTGVTDAVVRLGFAAVPTGLTNLAIGFRERGIIDSGRIEVGI